MSSLVKSPQLAIYARTGWEDINAKPSATYAFTASVSASVAHHHLVEISHVLADMQFRPPMHSVQAFSRPPFLGPGLAMPPGRFSCYLLEKSGAGMG